MSLNYPNAASALMGNPQMYDDSYLRKRVKCLTSAQLLCFVIGMAGLGTAIITLLKVGNEKELRAALMHTNDEIEILRHEVFELQMKVKELHAQTFGLVDPENPDEKTVKEGADADESKEQHPPQGDIPTIQESPHDTHGGHPPHHEDGAPTLDSDEDLTHPHPHPHPHHEESGEMGVEEPPEVFQPEENDTLSLKGSDLLCDDSDLCMPVEGSGMRLPSIEDSLQGFVIEDFGDTLDDCAPFPRPTCPQGATICYQEGRCPVPVCCFESEDE